MTDDFGIIEGFYWTQENEVGGIYKEFPLQDKIRLINFMGQRGLNTYLYDPKLLREGPKEIYERAFNLNLIGDTGLWKEVFFEAKRNGVKFIWGIAPGPYDPWLWGAFQGFNKPRLYLHSGWKNHIQEILKLVETLLDIGVHKIALLFDDSPNTGSEREIIKQIELVNIIEKKFPKTIYGLCPSKYRGSANELISSHKIYDENLPTHISLIITGPKVWCKTITEAHIPDYPSGRRVIIWDNWMASDTSNPNRLTFVPPLNRDNKIFSKIKAFLINLCFPAERVIPVVSGLAIMAEQVKYGTYSEKEFSQYHHTQEYISQVARDWAEYLGTDYKIPECILSYKILGKRCFYKNELEIKNFVKQWPSLKPFVEETFRISLA